MKKMFTKFIHLATAVSFFVLNFNLGSLSSAHAIAGLEFTWADQQSISVSGTKIVSPVTISISANVFPPGATGEQGSGEAIDKQNDCRVLITIQVPATGSAYTNGNPGGNVASSPGSTIKPTCSQSVADTYDANPITFTNTRGATTVPDETENQKRVDVSIQTTKPTAETPATITATFTPSSTASGQRTVTVTLTKMTDSQYTPEMNAYGYYGIAENVEPGTYTVIDSIGIGQTTFEKIKYSRGNVSYGESSLEASVVVTVKLNDYPSNTTAKPTLGPLTLVLTPPDGSAATEVQTNSADLSYRTENPDYTIGAPSRINAQLTGIFQNVEAKQGNYKVCVKGTDVCTEFTKSAGQQKNVDIVLSGDLDRFITLDGEGGTSEPTCTEAIDIPLVNFIICPVLEAIDRFIDGAEAIIESKLEVKEDVFKTTNTSAGRADDLSGTYSVWINMARFASGLLVLIALVMVVSTALGFNFVSAYTLKKLLPRIVIGAAGIWLSWTILAQYNNFINDLGKGLASLMYSAFQEDAQGTGLQDIVAIAASKSSGLTDTVAAGTFIGLTFLAGASAGIAGIGLVALAALGAIATGLVVLAVREILIVMFVMLAPLAIASWILPNTNKIWKLWSSNLNKMLLMFPMITLLFAGARILSWVSANAVAQNSGFIEILFPAIIYVLPLYFLPKVFKSSGALLSGLTNAVNKGTNKATSGYNNTLKGAKDNRAKTKAANKLENQQRRQARTGVIGTFSRAGGRFRAGGATIPMSTRSREDARRERSRSLQQAVGSMKENLEGAYDSDVLQAIASGKSMTQLQRDVDNETDEREKAKKQRIVDVVKQAKAERYLGDSLAQAGATMALAPRGQATAEHIKTMSKNYSHDPQAAAGLVSAAARASRDAGQVGVGTMKFDAEKEQAVFGSKVNNETGDTEQHHVQSTFDALNAMSSEQHANIGIKSEGGTLKFKDESVDKALSGPDGAALAQSILDTPEIQLSQGLKALLESKANGTPPPSSPTS